MPFPRGYSRAPLPILTGVPRNAPRPPDAVRLSSATLKNQGSDSRTTSAPTAFRAKEAARPPLASGQAPKASWPRHILSSRDLRCMTAACMEKLSLPKPEAGPPALLHQRGHHLTSLLHGGAQIGYCRLAAAEEGHGPFKVSRTWQIRRTL